MDAVLAFRRGGPDLRHLKAIRLGGTLLKGADQWRTVAKNAKRRERGGSRKNAKVAGTDSTKMG